MNVSSTTRVHPRTLHGPEGAFPRSAEYAAALTRPARYTARLPWIPVGLVILLIVVGVIAQVAS